MLSFATVRPLSEAKRIRMGLPPLPSNLLRMVQRVAGKENGEREKADPIVSTSAIAPNKAKSVTIVTE